MTEERESTIRVEHGGKPVGEDLVAAAALGRRGHRLEEGLAHRGDLQRRRRARAEADLVAVLEEREAPPFLGVGVGRRRAGEVRPRAEDLVVRVV